MNKIKRDTFDSNAEECIQIIKKYNIKYISFWENFMLEIVFHPTKDDVLTFEIKNSNINDWSRSLFIYSDDLTKIAKEFNLPNPIIAPSMYSIDGSEVIHSNPLNSKQEFEEMKMEIKIKNYNKNEVVNMKQNMRKIIEMYIKLHKACDTDLEEYNDIVNTIVNVIEENLEYYGISKYDYKNEGGNTTEAFEYYIEEMVKKYYDIPNWFETEYGKRCIYIPYDLGNVTKAKNILKNAKTKNQIIEILDWYKEIETGLFCQFDYEIITEDQISKVIQTYEHEEIRIDLQDSVYDFYNPIICWLNTQDVPTLMIMDWAHLKEEIDVWISCSGDIESFIEKFKVPTLEDKIKEKCLKIIKEKGEMTYPEIYEFFKYLKEHTNIISHVYYVEYGLKQSWKYPNITTSMLGLIDEMNKHCDYPEAKEGFLTDLTIQCAKNNVDADNGFIFWADWDCGCNYIENNKQITKHIIRWLNDKDFDLENHIALKLYNILTRG